MNRPGLEHHRLKPGKWLGPYYIADVCGGTVTALVDANACWTREEIEEEGKRLRASRKSAAKNRKSY